MRRTELMQEIGKMRSEDAYIRMDGELFDTGRAAFVPWAGTNIPGILCEQYVRKKTAIME